MTQEELNKIEEELQSKGYKKWTQSKTETHTAYEWMKSIRVYREEGNPDILISHRVWDFGKYQRTGYEPYSMDVLILFDVRKCGRYDVLLTDSNMFIDEVEVHALDMLEFLRMKGIA